MSNRETSPEIASLAGRILNEDSLTVVSNEPNNEFIQRVVTKYNEILKDAKKLAGSCLSQAEPDDGPEGPRIRMTATVDWDKITNAIVGVIEGGYSGWLHSFIPDDAAKAAESRGGEHTVWYNDPSFWIGGGTATATYDNPERASESGGGVMAGIARHDFTRGLALMAEKSPRHFGDLISESDDAITHDVFMQYVILGEVAYG